jgi:hypothetical protein
MNGWESSTSSLDLASTDKLRLRHDALKIVITRNPKQARSIVLDVIAVKYAVSTCWQD